MKARTKFLIGGLLVMSTAGYLMASSARDTAVYYLTPSELEAKLAADPDFRDAPMKIGADVVRGSIVRQPGGRELSFLMTDGKATFPVVYRGVPPDTFTDTEDIEVVVTGRLDADGTFQATELLAKCASRYESVPGEGGSYPQGTPGYGQPSQGYGVPSSGQPGPDNGNLSPANPGAGAQGTEAASSY
jgi:cytochrome c-type biogenesis protein CcmE